MDADGLMFLLIFFFSATVILLTALWLERKVERAIRTWGYCLKTGHWHSYTNRILYAEPPSYMLAEHEAKLNGEGW